LRGIDDAMTGHLIHIGYAKAGSTFLRSWFAQHPQLAYATGAIAGFSDVYSMVRASASPAPHVLYRVTSAEAFATPFASFGHAVPDYNEIKLTPMPKAQTQACKLLAALFPGAYILIVTRGFRSMIMSSYSQFVRTGGAESLAWFCGITGRADPGSLTPWNYDFLIGLYREAFGDANVLVLPYELLLDDAEAFLGEIAKRLGLADTGVLPGRLNPSLSPVELAWYPRLARRLRSLPLGAWGRRKAWQFYVHAALANQLRLPITLLQRLRPMAPIDTALTPEVMEGYRGFATVLRHEPLYRRYAREYLIE
jgi:Sulfotransferase family